MAGPRTEDWYYCPTCGSKVRVGSPGCRTCAAGQGQHEELNFEEWTREADAGLADIPTGYSQKDEDFDYDEFIKREFHRKSPNALNPVVIAVALSVFLVVLFLILAAQNL